jgi:hypothetical protein
MHTTSFINSYMCVKGMPHIVEKLLMRSYNFVIDITSIKGLHKKLWVSKGARIPISGFERLLM